MILSILKRKSRNKDRTQWQALLSGILPRITERLKVEQGFVSVQYLWDVYGEGSFAQITTWQSLEDCQRYVRDGGAAAIATIEEAAIPTALHPHGAWVRQTFEIAAEGGSQPLPGRRLPGGVDIRQKRAG